MLGYLLVFVLLACCAYKYHNDTKKQQQPYILPTLPSRPDMQIASSMSFEEMEEEEELQSQAQRRINPPRACKTSHRCPTCGK